MFYVLFLDNMITGPSDAGDLTALGRMSGNLPVDLHLSRLIGYGISLGIPGEAIAMAAALSLPKLPFRISNPLIHKGIVLIEQNYAFSTLCRQCVL